MPNNEIKYRDLEDDGLISFCTNNLSPNALVVLGVFIDTDGTVKVDAEQYTYLVTLYLEVGAQTGGKFEGVLDFTVDDTYSTQAKTDTLM
jgi:hypothetical protein